MTIDLLAGSDALDAYSRVVVEVAERLTPSVASLRVVAARRPGGSLPGAGSGVVISRDGYAITSAHVVAGTSRGSATFVDGHEARFEVVGRDPLSDLAVLRLIPATCIRRSSGMPPGSAWASWWWRSGTPWDSRDP